MAFDITYAGIPFKHLDKMGKAATWLQEKIAPEDLRELLPRPYWPGRNLSGVAVWQQPEPPRLQLGRYFYPSGASRWSQITLLATTTEKNKMLAATTESGTQSKAATFVMRADPWVNTDSLAQGGITTKLRMLPPRPLAQFSTIFEGIWMVTLVDERWLWQWTNAGQQQVTSSTTWNALLTSLISALGISCTVPTISSVYLQPAEDSPLYSNYENAALLLDAAAWNCGLIVVRNLDGTYQLQTPAAASTQAQKNRATQLVQAGGDALAVDSSGKARAAELVLPTTVTVTFPKVSTSGGFVDSRDARDRNSPGAGDVYASSVTLSDAGYYQFQGNGGTKVYADSAYALWDGSSVTNQTTLDALALQVAKDYFAAILNGLDEVYPGIRAWVPEAANDVLWTFRADRSYTRVMRKPWNYGPETLQHFSAVNPGYSADGIIWAQTLTDPPGPFSWQQMTPGASGTWNVTSGGLSGTTTVDPLYERNGMNIPKYSIVSISKGYLNSSSVKQEWICDYEDLTDASYNLYEWDFDGIRPGLYNRSIPDTTYNGGITYNGPTSYNNDVTYGYPVTYTNNTITFYYWPLVMVGGSPKSIEFTATVGTWTDYNPAVPTVTPCLQITFSSNDFDAGQDITTGTTFDVELKTVGVSKGGTGLTDIPLYNLLIGNGINPATLLAPGTAGRVLIDQGNAANPAYQVITQDLTLTGAGAATVTGIQTYAVSNAAPAGANLLIYSAVVGVDSWRPVAMSGDAVITDQGVLTVQGLQGKAIDSTAPTDKQIWVWNNAVTKWQPKSFSGDVSSTDLAKLNVVGIYGTPVSNVLPTDGQVLTYVAADLEAEWKTPSALTNPMTTLGDIIYENATPAPARLAGNTSSTKKFLTQTGTGSASAAPAWGTIASGDLPSGTATNSLNHNSGTSSASGSDQTIVTFTNNNGLHGCFGIKFGTAATTNYSVEVTDMWGTTFTAVNNQPAGLTGVQTDGYIFDNGTGFNPAIGPIKTFKIYFNATVTAGVTWEYYYSTVG